MVTAKYAAEQYINEIIKRSKSFENKVWVGSICFCLLVIVLFLISTWSDFKVVHLFSVVFILLILVTATIYLIKNTHACMNQCSLIKFQLNSDSSIPNIEKLFQTLKCTKDLNVDEFLKIINKIQINLPSNE